MRQRESLFETLYLSVAVKGEEQNFVSSLHLAAMGNCHPVRCGTLQIRRRSVHALANKCGERITSGCRKSITTPGRTVGSAFDHEKLRARRLSR